MAKGKPSGIRALDADIYRLYREGKRDHEIVEWLREQGYEVDRTTVLRARQRAEKEAALGVEVVPIADRETPEVDVTDDMIIANLIRDLARGYTDAKNRCDDQIKLDHAKRIAELAVARVRIRPPVAVGAPARKAGRVPVQSQPAADPFPRTAASPPKPPNWTTCGPNPGRITNPATRASRFSTVWSIL